MLSLTCGALYGARRQNVNVGLNTGERNQTVVERLDERHLFAGIGREEFFAQLYVEIECVLVALALHRTELLRSECREVCEHRLKPTGE